MCLISSRAAWTAARWCKRGRDSVLMADWIPEPKKSLTSHHPNDRANYFVVGNLFSIVWLKSIFLTLAVKSKTMEMSHNWICGWLSKHFYTTATNHLLLQTVEGKENKMCVVSRTLFKWYSLMYTCSWKVEKLNIWFRCDSGVCVESVCCPKVSSGCTGNQTKQHKHTVLGHYENSIFGKPSHKNNKKKTNCKRTKQNHFMQHYQKY